jgi:hypothetical protein
MAHVGEILLEYAYIIAPTSLLWILTDNYLWHTKLFQAMRKPLNIPPDIRGRWEGILENADGSEPQKFVIEVKNEDHFTLCYLWHGEINSSIKDLHRREHFYGYTMLN